MGSIGDVDVTTTGRRDWCRGVACGSGEDVVDDTGGFDAGEAEV